MKLGQDEAAKKEELKSLSDIGTPQEKGELSFVTTSVFPWWIKC